MNTNGTQLTAAKAFSGRKMEWKKPKDGKEFVGCLVGGRQETRREVIDQLWKRYGIRVIKHFGDEQRKTPGSIYIDSRVEVVILLNATELSDVVVTRVLACTRAQGAISIGIERQRQQQWDGIFAAEGFHNPPQFRDGYLIDNPADPAKLEAERKAELEALEKPRPAWVDPKLAVAGPTTIGDKLRMVKAEEVINQYKPQLKQLPPAAEPSRGGRADAAKAQRGKGAGFDEKPSPPGFPSEVREHRRKLGLQQAEFARKTGFNQSNISGWELGKSVPSYEAWLKLIQIIPGITQPPGIKGKDAHDRREREAAEAAKLKQDKKDARAAAKAEGAPPVVETPAPAPVVVAAPPTPAQEPERFAAKAIKAMDQEELLTVNLRSGGTLTLNASVSLLKLKGADRKFVFDIIDALQAYDEEKKA